MAKLKIGVWLQQIRAPFLILAVFLTLIGIGAATRVDPVSWYHALLLVAGVTLSHTSVNLFNELSDYRTKIDENTSRTPFSGGSGMMQAGLTSPAQVRIAAYGSLLIGAAIGIYFFFRSGWPILVFMMIGGMSIRFYTSHLTRWLLGEFISGLTLGSFVVLGVYYALTGELNNQIIYVSIPPGLLTSLLLFLNEFPDMEADSAGGRRHVVIQLGRRRSSRLYAAILVLVYLSIASAPFITDAPLTVLAGLLTLPLGMRGMIIVLKKYDDPAGLLPALGLNVGVVLLTDLLLALGYFFAR